MFGVQSLPLSAIKAVFEHSVLRPFLFSLCSMTLVSFLRPSPNHPSSFHVSELFQAPIFVLMPLLPLLFHSFQLLLRSDYIFCKFVMHTWYFQEFLDMYQITKSLKYLKVHAHPFLFIKEIIRILWSNVFSNSCLTDVLSDSSPTEIDFSSRCTWWTWK